MYSPTLGRFMQTDPIGVPGGVNLYAYVGNDPLNLLDLYGLVAEALQGAFPGTGFPTEGVRQSDEIFAVFGGLGGAVRALGSAVVQGLLGQSSAGGSAVVQTGAPGVQAGLPPAAQVAAENGGELTRVGRWMSWEEFNRCLILAGWWKELAAEPTSFAPQILARTQVLALVQYMRSLMCQPAY